MNPSFAFALLAALAVLPAQDRPAPIAEVPQLRAAFEAAKAGDWAALIAVVPGSEPRILLTGSGPTGRELTPQTLVPALVLAKLLAADAIHVQRKGKTDVGTGTRLGDRELTVRELLDGVTLLPNFYVLDGGDDAVDAGLLRNCGALAAAAKMQLSGNGLGAPEFVFLEPLVLGGRAPDWPSLLRTTLAPLVPGLDPVRADALAEPARSQTLLAADNLAKLATARPALLRTLLSLQNLGAWLQWRTRQDAPLWASARMGRTSSALTQPQEQRWIAGAQALGVSMMLSQYPSRQAALLWIHPPEKTTADHLLTPSLLRAFERELFAGGDEAADGSSPRERLRLAAAGRAAPAPGPSASSALDGTRWCAAGGDGKKGVRLAFGGNPREPLSWTLDGETVSFSMVPMGEGLRSVPTRTRPDALFQLWLRPEPDAAKPTRLTCVLLTERLSGGNTTTLPPADAAVPQYFELVPEKQ